MFRPNTKVTKCVFMKGIVNAIATRPYDVIYDDDGREYLTSITANASSLRHVVRETMNQVTPSILRSVLGKTLRFSKRGYELPVPGGYDGERLIFLIVLESRVGADTLIQYLQGYTDCSDTVFVPSLGIDVPADHVKLFLNNVTTVDVHYDEVTGRNGFSVVDALNIVYSHDGDHRVERDESYLARVARPQTLAAEIQMLHLGFTDVDTDSVTAFDRGGKLVSKSCDIANRYISDMVNKIGASLSENNGNFTQQALLSSTSLLESTRSSAIPFFKHLADLRDDVAMKPTEVTPDFSYRELTEMFPDCEDVLILGTHDVNEQYNAIHDHVTGERVESTADDNTTSLALEFCTGLLTLMAQHRLAEVGFTITNKTMSGSISVIPIIPYRSILEGIDVDERQEFALNDVVAEELFHIFTGGSTRAVTATVILNNLQEGSINFGGDGYYEIYTDINSAMNARLSPTITSDQGYDDLARLTGDIIEEV